MRWPTRDLCEEHEQTDLHVGRPLAGIATAHDRIDARRGLTPLTEAFGQALLDERFRCEDQTIPFKRNFQVVARCESQSVVQLFWNGDLAADSDFDNRH